MGCKFCASTLDGVVRNLNASEILSQIYEAQRDNGIKISHTVLMGMGEPLDNYDNVMRFLELITDEKGQNMSMRHISLSTCGVVPKIYDLMERYTLYINWDIDIRSRLAGGKPENQPENWMKNIHQ